MTILKGISPNAIYLGGDGSYEQIVGIPKSPAGIKIESWGQDFCILRIGKESFNITGYSSMKLWKLLDKHIFHRTHTILLESVRALVYFAGCGLALYGFYIGYNEIENPPKDEEVHQLKFNKKEEIYKFVGEKCKKNVTTFFKKTFNGFKYAILPIIPIVPIAILNYIERKM